MPMTILSYSALFEYSTMISLLLFLLILLIRYFGLLGMAYLWLNNYTFSKRPDFQPFVSVIVPVYNEGILLKDAIVSLLELDYSNYEIIVVNDGSTDNTYDVAKTM
ncbi:MAG: glycosyltransferase, partial [Ignavibacteriaceae bacterium]|nr:glycosyltransferase [Ignavibacteriaceae bacterium]